MVFFFMNLIISCFLCSFNTLARDVLPIPKDCKK
jgi:hypothetical protein